MLATQVAETLAIYSDYSEFSEEGVHVYLLAFSLYTCP